MNIDCQFTKRRVYLSSIKQLEYNYKVDVPRMSEITILPIKIGTLDIIFLLR